MSEEVPMLRYYMGLRVIGWIWIIAVLAFLLYRLFASPLLVALLEAWSGAVVNTALVALLALGILVEWYGSFKLFMLRRKIRAREEVKASEAGR